MSRRERQVIRQEMTALEVDLAANTFMRMVLAEFSFCCKYGQKRSGEVCGEGCHYTGYLCYEVRNCASNRLPGAIQRYAQALAWWRGERGPMPSSMCRYTRRVCMHATVRR